ncbi:MAG: hypothetical protein K2P04_03750 [Oscillospiraceae bacterium]|nr:hypothetical protein [Oscillospiraceae bacterium]
MESITYKVTYLGKEVTGGSVSALDGADKPAAPGHETSVKEAAIPALPYITGGLAVAAIIALAVMLMHSRREVRMLQEAEDDPETDQETEEHEQ